MDFLNNWRQDVTLAAGTTSLALSVPDGEYVLTIANSTTGQVPEIVSAKVAGGSATLLRAREGTSAQNWPGGSSIFCSVTAGTLADFLSRISKLESADGGGNDGGGVGGDFGQWQQIALDPDFTGAAYYRSEPGGVFRLTIDITRQVVNGNSTILVLPTELKLSKDFISERVVVAFEDPASAYVMLAAALEITNDYGADRALLIGYSPLSGGGAGVGQRFFGQFTFTPNLPE